MPFEPGKSGNPEGRPKGAINKGSAQVKAFIEDLLTDPKNVEKLRKEFNSLNGKDMLRAFSDLLPYVVPRLQSTSMEMDIERLPEDQLDYIIDRLLGSTNN